MENKHKRLLEWGQNLLILGLSLSAIVLISRSTLYEGFGILSNTKKRAAVRVRSSANRRREHLIGGTRLPCRPK